MTDKTYKLEVARRPWYEWLAWIAWAFAVVFTLQNAMASSVELEPRVASILWVVGIILLLGGAIVYFVRRRILSA
jgi:hypothetical protein